MSLTDEEIHALRYQYIDDDYVAPVPGQSLGMPGLSHYNRSANRQFRSDDILRQTADAVAIRYAFDLGSIYAAELDLQPHLGTAVTPLYLTTAQGANKDLTFTAVNPADDITVAYVVSGASTALSVVVSGKSIAIHVATTSGAAADSTANQIKAAVDATPAALALITTALASGSDGTGKPGAMPATHLTNDAQKAAAALRQDCFLRLIRASVFEDMLADASGGFLSYVPTDTRDKVQAEMRKQVEIDRQFVKDKTAQGRRRVAAGG